MESGDGRRESRGGLIAEKRDSNGSLTQTQSHTRAGRLEEASGKEKEKRSKKRKTRGRKRTKSLTSRRQETSDAERER